LYQAFSNISTALEPTNIC